MLDLLTRDLRYALRLIRKAPGFSAVAIASLAVAIGASTVLFSVANSFLFRPIQASRPEELIQIFTSNFGGSMYGNSSYADYQTFRTVPMFSGMLASRRAQATLSQDERPDIVSGLLVSDNYFEVLGLHPSRGRFFQPEENTTPGAHPVVVLSHEMWQRRFGADPAIAGRVLELNGQPFTVIGVGPPRFAGTGIEDMAGFFAPVMMQDVISPGAGSLTDRRQRSFRVLGRLKPGATATEAGAALRLVGADLARQDPVAWRDRAERGRIVTALPELTGRFAGAPDEAELIIFSSVLAGVVGLLAIACVNVATVLLARADARRKEIAVRLAIGASRSHLVRQLLTECAVLAFAGGALGVAIAQTAGALFPLFRPEGVPALDLTIDAHILLFSVAASLVTVVFFGLAPALQTTRPDVNADLRDTTRAVRVRGLRFGLRAGLVVVQVAVSLALMIGAALMLRSAHAGRTEDPGFRRADVLNVGINLSALPDQAGRRARIYEEAVRAVASLPGVERAALAMLIPMDGSNSQMTIRIAEGGSPISNTPDINIVGPGYFALLDIPVRQGREFTDADRESSPRVAVVNEMMARQFWNGNPVGKAITIDESGDIVRVVGVVRDLRHRAFNEPARPMVYFCAAQGVRPSMTLHVRTTLAAGTIAPALQRTLHEIERAAGLTRAESMSEYLDFVMLPQRLGAGAAVATGVLELALVVMALYGVIAFAASQRTREIGLRRALGASDRSVLALIMREGLVLTGAGVVLGVGVALVGASALQWALIGVGPADPVSFGGAALVLVLVGTAASYVPARRALSVDPCTALRSD